eukprot:TRINITY_DN8048_c0_g1_i1.p1 TRINITY_DN8048_c0_g1~~TRINITY_DN8048_c0_g1_i1.p1  ORF type:complete len:151 (+),score=51.55 TRINITY_DN8048_c0_g1_i1:124-576(+)
MEDSYRKQEEVDGRVSVLDIYDTAGTSDFDTVRDDYIKNGEGFLCAYAIDAHDTFDEVFNIHQHILKVKETKDVVFVICGTKSDLESSRMVTRGEGEEMAQKLNSKHFETSAKTGMGIQNAFHQLVRDIYAKRAKNSKPNKKKDKNCRIL